MNKFLVIFSFLFFTKVLFPQEIKLEYIQSIDNLKDATSIAVDQYRNLYVADAGTNQIIKYSNKYEIIHSIGGYGWNENSFDEPTDIAVSFDMFVYICDYNNHRIQHFDRNLNYVSSISETKNINIKFGYPRSIAISNDGNIFFIDGENQVIQKLDIFRNPIISFGGLKSGKGNLFNPNKIRINNNYVFVNDDGRIIQYDLYGNFINSFNTHAYIKSISFYQDIIILLDQDTLKFIDNKFNSILSLSTNSIIPANQIISQLTFRDVCVLNNYLYLLSNKKIFIFKIIQQ